MINISFRMAVSMPKGLGIDRKEYTEVIRDKTNNVKFLLNNKDKIIETMEEVRKKNIKFESANSIFITVGTRDLYGIITSNFDSAAGYMERNTSKFALAVYLVSKIK